MPSGGGVSSPSADVRTMRPDDIMYYLRKARSDEIRIATLGVRAHARPLLITRKP
jgi:hypothetical protein